MWSQDEAFYVRKPDKVFKCHLGPTDVLEVCCQFTGSKEVRRLLEQGSNSILEMNPYSNGKYVSALYLAPSRKNTNTLAGSDVYIYHQLFFSDPKSAISSREAVHT